MTERRYAAVMPSYSPPLRDVRFVLTRLLKLDETVDAPFRGRVKTGRDLYVGGRLGMRAGTDTLLEWPEPDDDILNVEVFPE